MLQAPEGPIDAVLARAYRNTHDRVDAPGGAFTIPIGEVSAELAALMRTREAGQPGAAFPTAYNPWSLPRESAENIAAQRALHAERAALGCTLVPGEGHDPCWHWPAEPSILALGLSPAQADAIARRWGRNAYVWIGRPGEPCSLLFTHPVADAAPRTAPSSPPTPGDHR
jgi:hypothetical protein